MSPKPENTLPKTNMEKPDFRAQWQVIDQMEYCPPDSFDDVLLDDLKVSTSIPMFTQSTVFAHAENNFEIL